LISNHSRGRFPDKVVTRLLLIAGLTIAMHCQAVMAQSVMVGEVASALNFIGRTRADRHAESKHFSVVGKAGGVVTSALNMIGIFYRQGGDTPDAGFDCSGFVRYVFKRALGFTLPRRAVDMSRVGKRVYLKDLKPGDLVFFDTTHQTFSHVGIYIGGGKFVHSPSTGQSVRIDYINDMYWGQRFTGGRHIRISRPASKNI